MRGIALCAAALAVLAAMSVGGCGRKVDCAQLGEKVGELTKKELGSVPGDGSATAVKKGMVDAMKQAIVEECNKDPKKITRKQYDCIMSAKATADIMKCE